MVSSQAAADHVLAIAQAMSPRKDSVVSLLASPHAEERRGPAGSEICGHRPVHAEPIGRQPPQHLTGENGLHHLDRAVFTPRGSIRPNHHRDFLDDYDGSRISSAGMPITLGQLLNIFIFRSDINLGWRSRPWKRRTWCKFSPSPMFWRKRARKRPSWRADNFRFPWCRALPEACRWSPFSFGNTG